MRALTLATVVKVGEGSKFKVGDQVTTTAGHFSFFSFIAWAPTSSLGWTEYAVMNDKALTKVL